MPGVLAYGESNTHGSMPMRHLLDVRRYPPGQRWTHHAAACLPGDVVLLDEGQPGRTTVHDDPVEGAHKNGLALLPAILKTHRPLDAVVLMLGTNDMKARFAVTPMDVALSLARLAAVVRGAGAGPDGGAPRLQIVAPPPIAETGCSRAAPGNRAGWRRCWATWRRVLARALSMRGACRGVAGRRHPSGARRAGDAGPCHRRRTGADAGFGLALTRTVTRNGHKGRTRRSKGRTRC